MSTETYPIEFTANQVELLETLLNVAKDELPAILESSAITQEEFFSLYHDMMKASLNLVLVAKIKEEASS